MRFVHTSMRIRTDGEYAHRQDTIDDAARAWGCNKTRAVLLSCELATTLLDDLPDLLTDDRLPPGVAADLAARLDGRYVDVDYERPTVTLTADE